jgi:uncharacterized membrane protein YdjX (TVP38/TMEM64 family)
VISVRYGLVVSFLLAAFLITFAIAEATSLPLLTDAQTYLDRSSMPTALLSVGLLVADVALPVPASAIMVAQGAAFGLVTGALLALLGATGATMVAYLVGRRSQPWVHRLVSRAERRRAAALMEQHGMWAVIISRPVPLLAETVAILSGVERLPWRQVLLAGAAGNVIPAIAYAAVGALTANFVNGLVVFAAACLVALVVGLIKWRVSATRVQGSANARSVLSEGPKK